MSHPIEDADVQGIRRVIAVTASEAEEAVSKAESLTKAMGAAEKLDGPKLDAEIAGLRQVWPSTSAIFSIHSHDSGHCGTNMA